MSEDSSVSESSDEETEDYNSEDESVDTESSDSSEEEATVITTPQIKGDTHAFCQVNDCPFKRKKEEPSSPLGEDPSCPNGCYGDIHLDILAQIEAQSSNHDCTFAHRRNKADLEDYWTIRQGASLYEDTDFTPDMSALYWSDM